MVEITPKVGMEQLTITGINRNLDTGENLRVVIRSLTANTVSYTHLSVSGESGETAWSYICKSGSRRFRTGRNSREY